MNNSMIKKRDIATFVALTCGVGLIYELAYLRNSFYIPMCISFNLTNYEFGRLSGIYALIATITYFIGGILSDKIGSRIVLFMPFFTTSIMGFLYSTFTTYRSLQFAYALMGITTVMTFYSFTIKTFCTLREKYGQNRIFGYMESGKGIVGGLIFLIMLLLFNGLGGGKFGFTWVIRAYSIINIVLGISLVLFVPDQYIAIEQKPDLAVQIRSVCFNKKVWLLSAIVFAAYSLYGVLSYIPSMLIEQSDIAVSTNSILAGVRYIVQIVAPVVIGLTVDRLGSSLKILLLCLGSCTILCITLYSIFQHTVSYLVVLLVCFILAFIIYGMKPLYYTAITEIYKEKQNLGTAIGLICAVGFSPEIYAYQMIGKWIDDGTDGYIKIIVYMIFLCVFGISVALVLLKLKHREAVFSTLN